jgi:hypothetical protein
MKKFIAVCAATAALAGAYPSAAEPESYTLVCRGAADTRIMVNHDVDGSGIPGSTAMTVYFRPGATLARPGAGECTWTDRGMGPGEPATLWFKSPNIEFAFQVTGDGRVVRDGSGLRLGVEGAHASVEAKDWQYIVNAVMQGDTFKVKAYNQGGSVMVVTEILRPR